MSLLGVKVVTFQCLAFVIHVLYIYIYLLYIVWKNRSISENVFILKKKLLCIQSGGDEVKDLKDMI